VDGVGAARGVAGGRALSRPVVLASTSPYRAALLARLGVQAEGVAPGVDEEPLQSAGLAPSAMVAALARAKAEAVAAHRPDAIVIGGDQCAALGEQVLGKPGSVARAVAQLERLSGRTHDLWTGVCVLAPGAARFETVDHHTLTMRALSRAQIEGYVVRDTPLDCAGSYKMEGLGVALFERVSGADGTAIVGLPLMWLSVVLSHLGVDVLTRAPS